MSAQSVPPSPSCWRVYCTRAHSSARGLTKPTPPPPGPTETQLVSAGVAGQSSARLFGALTRLEKRIFELEHTPHTPREEKTNSPGALTQATPSHTDPNVTNHSDHLVLLLAKGQS